jgi:hypothetical protein
MTIEKRDESDDEEEDVGLQRLQKSFSINHPLDVANTEGRGAEDHDYVAALKPPMGDAPLDPQSDGFQPTYFSTAEDTAEYCDDLDVTEDDDAVLVFYRE